MSENDALNSRRLFIVIIFAKFYMQQYFIDLQVSFYFIVLLTLKADILLKDINLFIESLVSVLKINLNRYFLYLYIDSHPFIKLNRGSRIFIWGSVVLTEASYSESLDCELSLLISTSVL